MQADGANSVFLNEKCKFAQNSNSLGEKWLKVGQKVRMSSTLQMLMVFFSNCGLIVA